MEIDENIKRVGIANKGEVVILEIQEYMTKERIDDIREYLDLVAIKTGVEFLLLTPNVKLAKIGSKDE